LRLFQKSFCKALRLASVRIFSEPPGDYGTRIDKAIAMSNTWEKEEEIARLYINRMSHLYGQGFWGSVDENGKELSKDLSLFLFKKELFRKANNLWAYQSVVARMHETVRKGY
jgi:cobalamin biosynthesis Mg chelatase CobN